MAAKPTQNSVTTPKTTNSDVVIEALHEFVCVQAFKNVEGLFFEKYLLVREKLAGIVALGSFGTEMTFQSGLPEQTRRQGPLHAMRGENRELRVVLVVIAAV